MSERRILVLSTAAALVMALLGLAFVVASQSRAILLDGVFNAVYFGVGLATLRIERLLREPDNARFPFGHAYFESLVNAGKGLLILGISMLALGDSIVAVVTGGQAVVAELAIVYAAMAVLVCALTAALLRRGAKRVDSPLVRADADNWRLNAVVSCVVLIGFCLAPVFEALGWSAAVPYIDPVLVAGVVLVFLGVPVRMARESILELLNRAPDEPFERRVTAAVDEALASLPVHERHVRMVRPGRTLYVLVHVVLSERYAMDGIAALDTVRAGIDAAVRRLHSPLMVDVVFTADRRWAEPSSGTQSPAEAAITNAGGRNEAAG